MEPTLDEVRQEFTDIHEELLTLPAGAFDWCVELRDRQNELRQLPHKLIKGQPLYDAETLRAAFNRLAELCDHLLGKRLSEGGSTSVGDAAIESDFTSAVSKAIESGLGIDEVEARLKEIIEQMRSSSWWSVVEVRSRISASQGRCPQGEKRSRSRQLRRASWTPRAASCGR